jgi:hypothetical protein
VKVKVPANVALNISVLDGNGRRLPGVIGSRHTNWLQVLPGQELKCNGCHNPNATPPFAHGRSGLTASVNPGAPTTGSPFPNTNPALFADQGETMAEVRNRVMCSGACEPSVDIAFDDYWPTAPIQASYDACYRQGPSSVLANPADPTVKHVCAGGLNTPLPVTNQACTADWNSNCRITIHYELQLHQLWSIDRTVDANNDGMPDLDPVTMQPINHKCTSCHAPVDAANAAAVPAGQLDLTDGPSDDDPDQFKAYRELLFADTELELQGGALVERQVQVGVDPVTGLPQFAPVPVPASMSSAGARASARFFDKLEGRSVGTVNHSDFMSPSELRLLSEWLDIGAQYYNDPFVAPEN